VDVDGREPGPAEQPADVGAHPEEGDVPEVEQPGEADDHVEADGGGGEDADGGEDPDPVGVASLGERKDRGRQSRRPDGHRPVAFGGADEPLEQSDATGGQAGGGDEDDEGGEARRLLDLEAPPHQRQRPAEGGGDHADLQCGGQYRPGGDIAVIGQGGGARQQHHRARG
jgi:hypothetical protein